MITLWDDKAGSVRGIAKAERENDAPLSAPEAFVADCAKANNSYSAVAIIRRGIANGWQFWLTEDGLIDLWAPADRDYRPTTYMMKNDAMRRVLINRGAKQLPMLHHGRQHAIKAATDIFRMNLQEA